MTKKFRPFGQMFADVVANMAATYGMKLEAFLAQTSGFTTGATLPKTDSVKSALRGRINASAKASVSDRKVGILAQNKDLGILREYRRAEKRAEKRAARAYVKAQTILSRKAQEIRDLEDEIAEVEALKSDLGSADRAVAVIGKSLGFLRRSLSRAVLDRARIAGRGFASLISRVTASMEKWDAEALERRLEGERSWTYQLIDLSKVNG